MSAVQTWQEWLSEKEAARLFEERKLSDLVDQAQRDELEARIKFCRARDRADSLRYKSDEKKKELDYARKKYDEFMEQA